MEFQRAVALILDLEGGDTVTDDPNDPGGVTKYGISQRAYPNENIRSLTQEQAEFLYKRDYWDAVCGDEIRWPVNLMLFDSAVNQGPGTAIRLLQRSLRLYEDGVIGPVTLAAANRLGARGIAAVMATRMMHYTRSTKFSHYGNGWFARCVLVSMEAGRDG